jgi:tetratricopeptide (TPR) repeat protein
MAYTESEALVRPSSHVLEAPASGTPFPMLPWRDPHTVPREELSGYIERLERACLAKPTSADLRVCLGMAHAVNFDVYKSIDALESAIAIRPDHFWAHLKYGELHYRLRALNRAEEETMKAMDLAETTWQLAIARKQLQEIRGLINQSIRNIEWNKPLIRPALALSAMMALIFAGMLWK